MTHNHAGSVPGFDDGVIRIGGRRYQRFNGTWMVQPPMLRGFVPADPVACHWLDEIERLRTAGDELATRLRWWTDNTDEAYPDHEALRKWEEARRG